MDKEEFDAWLNKGINTPREVSFTKGKCPYCRKVGYLLCTPEVEHKCVDCMKLVRDNVNAEISTFCEWKSKNRIK